MKPFPRPLPAHKDWPRELPPLPAVTGLSRLTSVQPKYRFMFIRSPSHALRRLVMQPLWLPVTLSTTLFVCAMAILVFLIHHGLTRFDPLYQQAQNLATLQQITTELRLDAAQGLQPPARLENRLRKLSIQHAWLSPATTSRLSSALHALTSKPHTSPDALAVTLSMLHTAAAEEDQARVPMLKLVSTDAGHALQLALALLTAFPLLVIALLSALQGRLVSPLSRLADLLTALADREYRPLDETGVAPVLRPLFSSYNQLVARLRLLEDQHALREQALSDAIDEATRSLFLTQAALTRAERLAAAGEVAASLAHDLRNPLAGIRMALSNLETESPEGEFRERITLIGSEIDRLVATLNSHLSRARHRPEPARAVDIGETLRGLGTLLRFRYGSELRVMIEAEEYMRCLLPESAFRHTLLNLLSNACEASTSKQTQRVLVDARIQERQIVITIDDDGPGFPAALLRTGPRPFASDKPAGTGLGLATARRFAAECGGQLQLSNRSEGGARARLVLPCETATRNGTGQTPQRSPQGG